MIKIKCSGCNHVINLAETDRISKGVTCEECGYELDVVTLVHQAIDQNDKLFHQCYKKYSSAVYRYQTKYATVQEILERKFATTWLIPATVERIERASFGVTQVENLLFEEGGKVSCIGVGAFANGSNLLTLELPESVETIGNGAFQACYRLKKVILPKNIVRCDANVKCGKDDRNTVAQNAFSACSGMQEIMHSKKLKIKHCMTCGTKMPLLGKKCTKCGCLYIPY